MEYINNPTYKYDTAIELEEFRDDDQPYVNEAALNTYEVLPEKNTHKSRKEYREHVYSDLVEQELDYENLEKLKRDPEKRTGILTRESEDDTEFSSYNIRQKSPGIQRKDVRSDYETAYTTPLQTRYRASVYSILRKRRFSCLRRKWKILLLLLIIFLLVTGVVIAVILVTTTEQPVENTLNVKQETTTTYLLEGPSGSSEGSGSTEVYGSTDGSGNSTEGCGSTDGYGGSTEGSGGTDGYGSTDGSGGSTEGSGGTDGYGSTDGSGGSTDGSGSTEGCGSTDGSGGGTKGSGGRIPVWDASWDDEFDGS
ncbi:keratin, type I cytoskeletal 9-like [Mercenaria mercenaria]|uniref:keratin, type I cytoskeletal 9-like n=1 Tax=Mercenaria mercenaria TaxID=6596 RepID=UPI00234EDB71|nr:keratin, type I cytoskeletal 9-like [Mercenaria mercenaria]